MTYIVSRVEERLTCYAVAVGQKEKSHPHIFRVVREYNLLRHNCLIKKTMLMLKEEIRYMKTISALTEIARREALLEIRNSLEVIGSYMPLTFNMNFRGYQTVSLDSMGVSAYRVGSTSIAEIAEWEYLTAEEILNIHCYIVRATQVTIMDMNDQLKELESVRDYFK